MSDMGIEFETRKENYKLVKWEIAIPQNDMNVTSMPFLVFDYSWNFVFHTKMQGSEEIWTITLHFLGDKKKNPCFPLIVSLRHKGRDLYLSAKQITYSGTEIWRCYSFRQKYPSIEVNRTRLQFVFDFYSRTRYHGISNTEEKSCPDTKYPENHACLENLSFDLSKLIEGGLDADVLIKCGDVSIGAHKIILGARSEVFSTMMQTDMVEGREGIVEIRDMEPEILKIFIKYIYTGILPELTMDAVLPIFEAADKYQVEALKKRSGHLLLKNLSPENSLTILVAADAHNDTNLKDQVVSYISEEKIPSRKEEWLNFCNEYPKLGNEVLNFMFFK